MNCLLINTATPQVAVMFVRDGQVVDQESWTGDKTLGTKLLSVVDALLVKQGLHLENIERVAVHHGPGHYSALRTGVMVATFLAMGAQAALVEVEGDDPAAMVSQIERATPVTVVKPRYV